MFKTLIPLFDALVEHSTFSSSYLKKRLIREGIFTHICTKCGLTEWLGNPVPLELHHKNGVHDDSCLENLCLLYPNCHSFTDAYRGRNQKRVPPKTYECIDCKMTIARGSPRCRSCGAVYRHKVKPFHHSEETKQKISKYQQAKKQKPNSL